VSVVTLSPRGWRHGHPPVVLLDARETEDGDIACRALIVTHAIKPKQLSGTWYQPDGRKARVRVWWPGNSETGMTEEESILEQA
jgi:hypothetical protein